MARTIASNCQALLGRSGSDPPITWGEALEATFWVSECHHGCARGSDADPSFFDAQIKHHARCVNANLFLCITPQDPDVGGVPNEAYVKNTPSMITVQGQNRAAIAISVFAQAYGLSKDRAGRCGKTKLFFGEGEQQPERNKEMSIREHRA